MEQHSESQNHQAMFCFINGRKKNIFYVFLRYSLGPAVSTAVLFRCASFSYSLLRTFTRVQNTSNTFAQKSEDFLSGDLFRTGHR